MKKFVAAALLTAFSAFTNGVQAAPIALTGAIGTTNLSTGTYNATFSGKSFLPENYLINALTFSFSFKDDANDGFTTSNPVVDKTTVGAYGYESGIFNQTYSRDVKVQQTVQRTGEQESAMLSIGGLLVGSGATALTTSSSTGSSTARVYDGSDCFIFCDYFYSDVTKVTTTITQDWNGGFTISGVVSNQEILDKLLANDQLLVSLKVTGDLMLTGGKLMLDYTKIDPNPVPEPSTLLLGAAGLCGLAYSRRRAKRA